MMMNDNLIGCGKGDVERQFAEQECGAATVARVALYLFTHEVTQKKHDEAGHGYRHPNIYVRVPCIYKGDARQQPLHGEADGCPGADAAVHGLVFGCCGCTGVWQLLGELGGYHLAEGVAREYHECRHGVGQRYERRVEQERVHHQPEHSVGANARIFHDVEYALAVVAAASETVEEVGQPVFVQCPGDKYAGAHGEQYGYGW